MFEIIVSIAIIIYIILCCAPAFGLMWETLDTLIAPTLSECLMFILGFPGTLAALIIKTPIMLKEKKEKEEHRIAASKKAVIFGDECRKVIKKFNDSQTVIDLAQRVKNKSEGCDYIEVSSSEICCIKKSSIISRINFEGLGLKALSTEKIYFKDFPVPRGDVSEWISAFKSQNKDIVGLYLVACDDDTVKLCLNECAVVASVIARILGENYTFRYKETSLTAIIEIKKNVSLNEWY